MEGATLLIVEDDEDIAHLIEVNAADAGYSPHVASDGYEALDLARRLRPSLIILDVMLPDIDGFEVCRRLRAQIDVPILMLTARDGTADRVKGLQGGADDYLVKPFSFNELLARIQAITRRGRTLDQTLLRIGDLQIDLISRRVLRAGQRMDLTAKEFALLNLLAKRKGEILSKTVIAELVWDMNFDSNTNVVEVAIKRLRAKIDQPFDNTLLHTIRGMGYVMEDRSETH